MVSVAQNLEGSTVFGATGLGSREPFDTGNANMQAFWSGESGSLYVMNGSTPIEVLTYDRSFRIMSSAEY
jgi:hypothetical protein